MKAILTTLSLLLLVVLVGCNKPEATPPAEPAPAASTAPEATSTGGTAPVMSEAEQRQMKSGN